MSDSSQISYGSTQTVTVSKWVVASTVILGAFMSVMNVSVVNVAMPHMMGSFSADLSSITWVATAYSIAEIILVTMTAWLSTLIGRKRLYLWSFGLFTLGSVLCGTAVTFPQMIFYRVIQGVGGGALIPISQAVLRESFPQEEQAMAMAIYGMGTVVAPATGPILGGWLTDTYGWPWIFFINVPVGIVGMFMVGAFIHDPQYLRRGVRKVDWLGIFLLAIALTIMQTVLERGERENWFESDMITLETILCVLTLLFLVYWEMKIPEPIINFRVLRNIPLTIGSSLGVIFGVALLGTTFILPQFLQNLLDYPAFEAGLVLAPRAITMMIFLPIIGRLYNRVDPRVLVLTGIGIICWSYYQLASLTLDAGFWDLAPALLAMGIGMPTMFVTISTFSLSTIPHPDMTDATSFYTLARRVGGNIGYALAATLVARGQQIHRAELIGNVNPFNPNYAEYSRIAEQVLSHTGLDPHSLEHAGHVLVDRMVNRQATMLAYNDVSWVFGILFLCVVPLVLLLSADSRSRINP